MRVPWTARRSNQSILKEISPKYSLEGVMLKLKLQHFGHLMRRTDSLEKTLMLGKIEGGRRRRRQRIRWLDGITDSMDMSLSSGSWCWTGKPGVLQLQRAGHDLATKNQQMAATLRRFLPKNDTFSSAQNISPIPCSTTDSFHLGSSARVFPWVDSLPSCSR